LGKNEGNNDIKKLITGKKRMIWAIEQEKKRGDA